MQRCDRLRSSYRDPIPAVINDRTIFQPNMLLYQTGAAQWQAVGLDMDGSARQGWRGWSGVQWVVRKVEA